MKNILLLYHSQSGNTEQLARACAEGIGKEEVQLRFLKAFDTKLEDVLWCDGMIIGSPENFGYMCGAVKDFFDRTYYPSRELELVRPYALFISCENDGSGAVREIGKIANGYVLKPTLDPIIVKGLVNPEALNEVREMGQTFVAGLNLEIF